MVKGRFGLQEWSLVNPSALSVFCAIRLMINLTMFLGLEGPIRMAPEHLGEWAFLVAIDVAPFYVETF